MNIRDLASKLLGTPLSESDEKRIVYRLSLPKQDPELFDLLMALGKTGDPRHRVHFQRALCKSDDPMVSELALKALVRWMPNNHDYRSNVLRFLQSSDSEFRIAGANLTPDCLEKFPDPFIVNVVRQLAEADPDRFVREAAQEAIARMSDP
jgi:hypothetical protein